jgi:hypothetical protein
MLSSQGRRAEFAGSVVLLLAAFGLAALFLDQHLNHSFITYRMALNLRNGVGPYYNPGEASAPYGANPAYAIVLAAASIANPDIPLLSNILSAAATGIGAVLMFLISLGTGRLEALYAGLICLLFPVWWMMPGSEHSLWMALCLLAIYLSERDQGVGWAVALSLATWLHVESAILLIALGASRLAARRSITVLPLTITGVMVLVGWLWFLTTYPQGRLDGSGLPLAFQPDAFAPDVSAGLVALTSGLLTLSWGWLAVLALALPGLLALREQRWLIPLAIWAVLQMLVLMILHVPASLWHFAPVLVLIAGLFAAGVQWIGKAVPTPAAVLIAAGLVIGWAGGESLWNLSDPAFKPPEVALLRGQPINLLDASAGTWLAQNTVPSASVGVMRPGLTGYLSGRREVDYYGQVTPLLAEAAAREDGGWWITATRPDYVVLRHSEQALLAHYALLDDAWFTATYAQAVQYPDPDGSDSITIWQRTSPIRPMQESLAGYVGYADGLTLNGIASDFSLSPLESIASGLVRLEWLLNQPLGKRVVAIRVQGRGGGAIAGLAQKTVDFSAWPLNKLITSYHPFAIAQGIPPGVYDVEVGIGTDPANLAWQAVAQAKVPFTGNDALGGISGARTEFGEIALIGYRLARTDGRLDVFLLWETVHIPQADYRVWIQVRDQNGAIVAQSEVEPHNGLYPTSVWSVGEQIPDTYPVDISSLPPGTYEVYAGLTNPDNTHILSLDGKDEVFIGRMDIAP